VVEPIHSGLNFRFDMSVVYLRLIIFLVIDNIPVDNDALLMTDFMNLKIKSVPSFEGACCTTLSVDMGCARSMSDFHSFPSSPSSPLHLLLWPSFSL
jgi:hypothetical protein